MTRALLVLAVAFTGFCAYATVTTGPWYLKLVFAALTAGWLGLGLYVLRVR